MERFPARSVASASDGSNTVVRVVPHRKQITVTVGADIDVDGRNAHANTTVSTNSTMMIASVTGTAP